MQLSIIFGLFILARSKAINEDNSTEKYPTIMGGDPINIEKIPYQVSIRLRCEEKEAIGLGHYCGGTLISQRAVLTLASCCFDVTGKQIPKNNYQLVMGNSYLITESSTEKKYGVTDLRIHNLYVYGENAYNIAILFINGVVPSSSFIRSIELTKSPVEVTSACVTSGWGATSEKIENAQSISNALRSALLIISTSNYCNISNEIANLNTFICVSGSFCLADKGGPLVCNDELAAVMLDSQGCGKANVTSIYLSVSLFHDWIKEQTITLNNTRRAKSIANSLESFDHRWHCFVFLVALFHGFAH